MMMKYLILILISLLIINTNALSSREKEELGRKKLNDLYEKSKNNALMSLNAQEFEYYVHQGPRPYTLILELTQISMGNCGMCRQLHPELKLVAEAYENLRYTDSESPSHRVFFVTLDASREPRLFTEMGLTTIPHLVHVKPTRKARARSWDKLIKDRMSVSTGFEAEKLKTLLRSRIDNKISSKIVIERPPEPINWGGIVLVIMLIISGGIFLYKMGQDFLNQYVRNRHIYTLIAITAYLYCSAGGMYNGIRNTQWAGRDRGGQMQYIHPGSHNQFGAETWIVSFLNFTIATTLVLLSSHVVRSKLPSYAKNVALIGLIALLHVLYRQMRSVYTRKNGGYNMGMVWP